jgi:hypothetical protein
MKNLLLTTALCFAATSAAAELTYGAAFVKAHNFDSDAGSTDLWTLGGGFEYRLNNYTFSGKARRIDTEEDDIDAVDVGFGYTLQNGVTLGLDYSGLTIADDGTDIFSGYAMYTFGAYTLGLALSEASDLDDTGYTVFGAWDVSEHGTVGLDLIRIDGVNIAAAYADYDLDRYSIAVEAIQLEETDVVAISGAYDFGNNFSVIGSLTVASDEGDDLTGMSIGAQYEFVPGANVELAVGRLDFDDADNIDRITLGVNYEFGKRTSKRRTLGGIFADATAATLGLTDF